MLDAIIRKSLFLYLQKQPGMIDTGFLHKIRSRAASLTERYGPQLQKGVIPDDMPVDLLLHWERILTDHHGSHLNERLALFRHAEKEPADSRGEKDWTETFRTILKFYSNPGAKESQVIDPRKPVPFEELLLPFVLYVSGELQGHGTYEKLLSPEARRALLRHLLEKLSGISSRCFFHAFATFRQDKAGDGTERYRRFIGKMTSGGILHFFEEYAALARLMTWICQQWIVSTQTFLLRLGTDLHAIAAYFGEESPGRVIHLKAGTFVAHGESGDGYEMTFQSGLRLLYKPRSGAADLALAQILEWLNMHGEQPELSAVRVLSREEYSWHAYIRHRSCRDQEDVRNYYRRVGQLAALLQVLGSMDYHFDNLRADGSCPYLVDNETLFSPEFRISADQTLTGDVLLDTGLRNSLARSLFLSDTMSMFFPHVPGIQGVFAHRNTYLGPRFTGINSDRMQERQGGYTRTGKNIPSLGRRKVNPEDYIDEIQTGYADTLRCIDRQKEAFYNMVRSVTNGFAIPIRLLIRPTAEYEQIMYASLAPKYLREGHQRSILFERMALIYLHSSTPGEGCAYLRQELRMLEHFLIPAFFIPMHASSGSEGNLRIPISAEGVFSQNLESLSGDFIDSQIQYLEWYLRHKKRPPTGLRRNRSRFARDTLECAEHLMRVYRHFYPVDIIYNRIAHDPGSPGKLYALDALGGVVLIHAAMHRIDPACDLSSLDILLMPLIKYLNSPGQDRRRQTTSEWNSGVGSVISMLLLISDILKESGYAGMIRKLAGDVVSSMTDRTDLSYYQGKAGFLLNILNMSDAGDDTDRMSWIKELRAELMAACEDESWLEVHGLFHGIEGILFVLSALHQRYPDPLLENCLVHTYEHLEGVWRKTFQGRQRERLRARQLSLSEGLAGWLLTERAVRISLGRDLSVHPDISRLLTWTKQDADTVLYGIAGRAEPVIQSDDADLKGRLVKAWMDRIGRSSLFRMHPSYLHTGFFRGLAGILYQQMRLEFPGELPSAFGLRR